jgi:hypothetical protein
MRSVGKHSPPLDGTVTANGRALAPFTMTPLQKLGPVSALPRVAPPGAERAAPERPGSFRDYPWPLLVIAAPAAVAIWSGWVGLGEMCGFGPIRPLPGIAPAVVINTAITLPVGVEAYGAYALAVWLGAKKISARTRRWARNSALGALALGCLGQVTFHLLSAASWVHAPWPVVTAVSCLPVVSLALAAALAHMIRADARQDSAIVTPPVTPDVTPARARGKLPARPPRKPVPAARPAALAKAPSVADVIRDNPGLTNAELAALAGCSKRNIQRYKPKA